MVEEFGDGDDATGWIFADAEGRAHGFEEKLQLGDARGPSGRISEAGGVQFLILLDASCVLPRGGALRNDAVVRRIFILAAALFFAGLVRAGAEPAFRVLVFSKTLLYRHASIAAGIETIQKLGRDNNFAVDASEDSEVITKTNLARYAVVVFLSVTGNVMDENQQAAFKDYIENGGGFVAIHGALAGREAAEGDWPWYAELLGTTFVTHTPVVPGVLKVDDTNNPSTAKLPARWPHAEEWYFFSSNPRAHAHVLLTVDESSFLRQPINADHPISWRREEGKGRVWYTALGHTDECFAEPLFQAHLLGGIQYAAGPAGKTSAAAAP